jgi:hypothetical protein
MAERGKCRSCSADVLWVVTENGTPMPLDFEPVRRFVIDSGVTPMRARQRNTYVSHFSTCPQADRWRNKEG